MSKFGAKNAPICKKIMKKRKNGAVLEKIVDFSGEMWYPYIRSIFEQRPKSDSAGSRDAAERTDDHEFF